MSTPTDHDHDHDHDDLDARAWAAQREALRGLHRGVLDEGVPPRMLQAMAQAAARRRTAQRGWQLGALAASVLLAFAAGWLGHGRWAQRPSSAPAGLAFAHDAALAHVVYSPEKRHPVEVGASEQQHLVQWLSRRLDRPLKVPELSSLGYTLVGGRLLPGEAGARAQFMFEDPAGLRVTLYIGALAKGQGAYAAQESAFRFAADDPVPSFYWVDQGFGYALAGRLPREALLALATAVYKQL